MKTMKRFTALILALVMAAMLAVSAYAATVVVKYKVYVYTSQLTFKQYDYSSSTTPSTRNLTILADSSLGSGSALYHVKYVNGAVAYCIQPGVRSDDSGNYVQGSSGCWYNLPASVQSGIALALACGYPSAEYGTAYGDSNSSDIIGAEKWAATQAVIWDLICEYRSPYDYRSWGSSPFYNCVDTSRYADAVSLLLCNGQVYERPAPSSPKKFALPTASGNMRRVFAYLTQHRRIHREVVAFFAHAHLLYEDETHHNCIFVGVDENGTARHAHLRSTASQGKGFCQTAEGSDARYSFHFAGGGEALYVFESPIDLLSYITLHMDDWQTQNYVACCGAAFAPVEQMLRAYPQIQQVYLCLDNDEAGYNASQRMEGYLRAEGISAMRLEPVQKDWNEDLMAQEVST